MDNRCLLEKRSKAPLAYESHYRIQAKEARSFCTDGFTLPKLWLNSGKTRTFYAGSMLAKVEETTELLKQ